ncbi:short-chain dehydrogenase/reductase-like protein SDR [Annulohypoxylon bovei var. microspora]|nr:short-chain dehydrogenase/reductase-like protein SDR [Annulohypoxylon bovei var. microspora]
MQFYMSAYIVTGCSSGIGQALAQLIAKTSNRVVATARKAATLSSIPTNDRVLKLELDVTSISSIDAALRDTLDQFGRIDIVVNNAGYTLAGDTEAAGDEEARAVMDTNFWSMVNISKRCLRIMREENPKNGQQGGVILNMSSMGGYTGYPGQAFYHASKFAMEGWTESVAKEVPSIWNSKFLFFDALLVIAIALSNANCHDYLVHLCNIEPGGVKTNYATSSLKPMAKRHEAYADPSYPANQLLRHMANEQARALWAEPSALAAAVYQVVSREKRIPIRVPLGSDAWGMIAKDLESTKNDLDEVKDISLSVSSAKQLDSIRFLASS